MYSPLMIIVENIHYVPKMYYANHIRVGNMTIGRGDLSRKTVTTRILSSSFQIDFFGFKTLESQ